MQFRTELSPTPSPQKITHADGIVSVGSCFAERVGTKLLAGKFEVLINPFGVIFNPLSLFDLLQTAVTATHLPENLYTERDGIHLHYLTHSRLWATTKNELASQIHQQLAYTREKISQAKYVFITLGTAWVYELVGKENTTVANCHKQPAHLFQKKLLSVEQIVTKFELLQASIQTINPQIQYILTVSPVRHIKDTLELNAVGKAVLRLAAHELVQKCSHVQYFPAYELLLDDLRDYRFYAPDLLHPSEAGEEYIWEKFAATYFSTETKQILQKIHQIQASIAHRPLQNDKKYQDFLHTLEQDIKMLLPKIPLQAELAEVQARFIRTP